MRSSIVERLFRELTGLTVDDEMQAGEPRPDVIADISVSDVEFTGTRDLAVKILSNKVIQAPIASVVEGFTRITMAQLLTTAIKVGPKAYPRIQEVAERFAARCGLPTPSVYIVNDSSLNACTLGDHKSFAILLNSGLVESLTDSETDFVIGHEIGHIHGNHVVLGTLLRIMNSPAGVDSVLSRKAGYVGTALSAGLSLLSHLSLKDWERSAELTCDRYGLLCCEDRNSALQALGKVGTGMRGDLDIDGFIGQMADVKEDWAARTLDVYNNLFASHPSSLRRLIALKLFADNRVSGRMTLPELDEKVSRIFLGSEYFMGDAEEKYERLAILSAAYLHQADGFISPDEKGNLVELSKSLCMSAASQVELEHSLGLNLAITDIAAMDLTEAQKNHLARTLEGAIRSTNSYSIEVDKRLVQLWEQHKIPTEKLIEARSDLVRLAPSSMVVELLDRSHLK